MMALLTMEVTRAFPLIAILIFGISENAAQEKTNFKAVLDVLLNLGRDYYFGDGNESSRYDCPICDSSVYSYCSEKLLHDACCCLNPYDHRLPRQCRYADCSFLHANSCREHKLITACCCSKYN